ncbi:YfgM family protein [Candidatus Regiella insecticola]|uniref:Ancillary SecYEG translocon subunit n=1 Tax=Candidatus Regiella insecticola TaxID=138073 RepID=A0A6L2ZRD3_9ENTR|nr:YfgM family protein [Candidatus Regiella insecticola]GFN46791.1 putative membrane protein [Candidatus Regiella insecticola]
METYTTENEQADAVRRFFSENAKILVVSVLLIIAVLIGWHYWQNNQNTAMKNAASSYQQVSEILTDNKKAAVTKSGDNTNDVAEQFVRENDNNYAVFIALELANRFVVQKLFDKAEQQLMLALTKTKDTNLLSLTNLRLAKLQLQLNKPDHALKTLNSVEGEAWVAMAEDMRGDIFLNKGDIPAARAAYTKATEVNAAQTLQTLLRLKLDNL